MDEIEIEIEDGHIRSSMEIQMIPLLDPRCAQWQVSSHPAPSSLHLNLSSVIVTSCPSVAAERDLVQEQQQEQWQAGQR